jgi:hypothetical protein
VAAKLLTALGVATMIIGIAAPYLELSYVNFWSVIAAGGTMSLAGAIACAWRASRRAGWIAGAVSLAVACGSLLLALTNVHGSVLFLFVAAPAFVLGLILLLIGGFRGRRPERRVSDLELLSRRVRDESMRVNAEFDAIEGDPGD